MVGATSHLAPVPSAIFVPHSPDWVVTGTADGAVILWDWRRAHIVWQTKKGHAKGVSSLAASPDGRLVASGSWDGTATIWDLETGKLVRAIDIPENHSPFGSKGYSSRPIAAG
ncbi:MAG: WD40 repeat domain-containing protein [Actinomycetota bacterium]